MFLLLSVGVILINNQKIPTFIGIRKTKQFHGLQPY